MAVSVGGKGLADEAADREGKLNGKDAIAAADKTHSISIRLKPEELERQCLVDDIEHGKTADGELACILQYVLVVRPLEDRRPQIELQASSFIVRPANPAGGADTTPQPIHKKFRRELAMLRTACELEDDEETQMFSTQAPPREIQESKPAAPQPIPVANSTLFELLKQQATAKANVAAPRIATPDAGTPQKTPSHKATEKSKRKAEKAAIKKTVELDTASSNETASLGAKEDTEDPAVVKQETSPAENLKPRLQPIWLSNNMLSRLAITIPPDQQKLLDKAEAWAPYRTPNFSQPELVPPGVLAAITSPKPEVVAPEPMEQAAQAASDEASDDSDCSEVSSWSASPVTTPLRASRSPELEKSKRVEAVPRQVSPAYPPDSSPIEGPEHSQPTGRFAVARHMSIYAEEQHEDRPPKRQRLEGRDASDTPKRQATPPFKASLTPRAERISPIVKRVNTAPLPQPMEVDIPYACSFPSPSSASTAPSPIKQEANHASLPTLAPSADVASATNGTEISLPPNEMLSQVSRVEASQSEQEPVELDEPMLSDISQEEEDEFDDGDFASDLPLLDTDIPMPEELDINDDQGNKNELGEACQEDTQEEEEDDEESGEEEDLNYAGPGKRTAYREKLSQTSGSDFEMFAARYAALYCEKQLRTDFRHGQRAFRRQHGNWFFGKDRGPLLISYPP